MRGHSAEVANKKSTFPPFSFESNKRFHVNHLALAGRDREKKEDSSLSLSLPFFSVCWVSLVWRAGGQSGGEGFFISVCVVASASFHQVNYPFREQRRADMRGMQPSDEFDWSRAERVSVCVPVYIFQFPPPYSYGNSSVVQYAHISSFPLLPDNKLMTSNICIVSRGLLFFRA
jgi:hypothetical protein